MGHGRQIGIEAYAAILQVDNDGIKASQHFRRWFVGFAVEAVDGQVRDWIDICRDAFAGLGLTTQTVLGAEERHQVDGRVLVKQLDAAAQAAIDAAGTSDQRYSFARNQIEPFTEEYFKS